MNRVFRISAALAAAALLASTVMAEPEATAELPVVVLLDGREVVVEDLRLADGKLNGKEVDGELVLDDIRQIRWRTGNELGTANPGIRVQLHGEGQLNGSAIAIADDQCQVTTATAGELKLPIDVLRSIEFDLPALPADYHKALAAPSAETDQVFLRGANSIEGLQVLIESLDEKEITFDLNGQTVTQGRDKVVGIVMARAIAGDQLPQCTVTLTDGSGLGGELTGVTDKRVTLRLAGDEVEIPLAAVRKMAFRSSKMAFLSDLKPKSAQQVSLVTLTRPWQRDRSYSGKPLQLGERVFEKGIGAHSRSELTFALESKYDEFAAVVGIDAVTAGKGDCVMSVLADGNQVWSARVRGVDPPKEIKVAVAGVDELTLLVEPGEELDLADHANWADARVIRTSK